jgi:hypothetical protein
MSKFILSSHSAPKTPEFDSFNPNKSIILSFWSSPVSVSEPAPDPDNLPLLVNLFGVMNISSLSYFNI